jgi:N-acetylmuramoyl-L-alanine amidase
LSSTGSRNRGFLLALLPALFLSLFVPCAQMRGGSSPLSDLPDGASPAVPARLVEERFGFRHAFAFSAGTYEILHGEKSVLFVVGTGEAYLGDRAALLGERVTLSGTDIILPAEAVDLVLLHLLGKRVGWRYENGTFTAPGPGASKAPTPGVDSASRGSTSRGGSPPTKQKSPGGRTAAVSKGTGDVLAVVLDPGHGGKDPGGVGYRGIKEKTLVLNTALDIQRELRKKLPGKEIILTRSDDSFITLEERSEAANSLDPSKNAVFVSVHANVSLDPKARGFESYYLSVDSYDETSREVASMENSVLSFEMDNYSTYLREIINRIVDVEYRRESSMLAGFIQDRMGGSLGRESVDRGVKNAFFFVLKSVKMPSVLVEMGFVTNSEEAERMLDADHRKKIARGIADGIVEFTTVFRRTQGFTNPGF